MTGRPPHLLAGSVAIMAQQGHPVGVIAEALALKPDTVRTILRRLGWRRVERWELPPVTPPW